MYVKQVIRTGFSVCVAYYYHDEIIQKISISLSYSCDLCSVYTLACIDLLKKKNERIYIDTIHLLRLEESEIKKKTSSNFFNRNIKSE